MLRYSGMTFKMVDSKGVSHEVKQVSAPVAKKPMKIINRYGCTLVI